MNYFEIRLEDRQSTINWLQNHRHDFLCKVYDRIEYTIENDLKEVKLFKETIAVGTERRTVRTTGIQLKELKSGSFLKNVLLKHFERIEDYEKCQKITEWVVKLNI